MKILRLALPSIVSNITVPLLGLVDLAIVGHMGSVRYIAAIAVGSMAFNVIYWLFGFLRMGTGGMTSQAYGRRDLADSKRLLLRSLAVSLMIASCFIACQVPLCRLMLMVMHPTADVAPLFATYFGICIWGAPAMLALYSLTGWYVGMQNTRIPMLVSIVQNVVNIVVSLSLVLFAGMKIEGVALGTLIAQWAGALLSGALVVRYYNKVMRYKVSWRQIFRREAMNGFFKVNRDIFMRTVFLVAVNLSFTAFGAHQGDTILAVNTLLITFYTIFSYVMDGFAYAAEALCGKAYGAGNAVQFRRLRHDLSLWGAIMVVAFTLAYAVGGHGLVGLLTDEPSVAAAAMPYYGWTLLIPICGVMAFIYDGIFIGITATRGMLLSTFLGAAVFFAIYLLLFGKMGNHALWLALIVFLFVRGLTEKIYLRRTVRL